MSEENAEPIFVEGATGDYIVAMDPLDGSSNIDVCIVCARVAARSVLYLLVHIHKQVNISIGSIFAVYHREVGKTGRATVDEVLRPGADLIAAGYTM